MAQTNLNADQISSDDFTSVAVPSGTTGERPSTAVVGMIRYNTTEDALEGYDGAWKKFDLTTGTQTASNSIPTDSSTQTKAKLNLISEFYGTGAYQLPSGTTGQRPNPSTNGMMRYNTTTSKFEGYKDGEWVNFNLNAYSYDIEYLSVAGGGGGGSSIAGSGGGGGGGAGGMLTGTLSGVPAGTALTITVGSGGSYVNGQDAQGGDGSNSSISGSGIATIASIGGGGGGSGRNNATTGVGRDGGSGGGGGYRGYTNQSNGGSGTSGQGNDGGDVSSVSASGAGGGGAGGAGNSNTGSSVGYGGAGGAGLASTITGTSVTYAAGGRGGDTPALNGADNTGNGGSGAYSSDSARGGGSGVVILKVPTSSYSGTTTGSPTVSTSGDYTIIKFTASGTYTT